jgi:hypothetical protein
LPASATVTDLPADQDHEFHLVSEAVLRECIVNLARIKEAVSISVQKPTDFPPQGLDNVPQLLRGITAGLLMLGKGRAVELMDAIGTEVRKLIEPGAPVPDALRSSASSTTWKRCKMAATIPGTCWTTPRCASRRSPTKGWPGCPTWGCRRARPPSP